MQLRPFSAKTLKYDIPASVVVFLVALPLCLGIALASGAPAFSGIIAGIVGGIVVGSISGSHISVSGPAAGLTVIVLNGITDLGGLEIFLGAVVVAGLIQLILGFVKAGVIAYFFPHNVIKGMLAAIGLILILKQLPHAMGYDANYEGDENFYQPDKENTFSEIIIAAQTIHPGAVIIASVSLLILMVWGLKFIKNNKVLGMIPAPLLAVGAGIGLNQFFVASFPELAVGTQHLVSLPIASSFSEFAGFLTFPDFSMLGESKFWIVAFTIAIIASIESLLSLDASDKLDAFKRRSPSSRELKAQGVGNIISGLLGGIPVTAVIVRSSANATSGARTKASAIIHGALLLLCVAFIPVFLNLIPLAALASVLLLVGYKLTQPSLFVKMFKQGWAQFLPFIVTIIAILRTDLLEGIIIGMAVGIFFVIKSNYKRTITITKDGQNYLIKFNKDATFLNKAYLVKNLEAIAPNSFVVIDLSRCSFVDNDIEEAIEDFSAKAKFDKIEVDIKGLKQKNEGLRKVTAGK